MADKNYILEEIRRTAESNGGVPLGSKRFSAETGIKETDWSGKHWARWGDALVEAGFSPNEFQAAYPDDFLLQKLAALVQELRHFPVTREIKMKAARDPTFPSAQTFRRLGGKSQLAVKLCAFCQNRDGYAEVVSICASQSHAVTKSKSTDSLPARLKITGEVYLLKSGRYYKIGKTNAVGRREYELGIKLPEKPTLAHVIKTDDPTGIELYWHRRFETRHKNGEWFELTPEDIAAFKWRKFM
jgi:hypothetical protein